MLIMDTTTQIFKILKQKNQNYIVKVIFLPNAHKFAFSVLNFGFSFLEQDDFKPLLKELLATHPGLEFLQTTPEFQERYG